MKYLLALSCWLFGVFPLHAQIFPAQVPTQVLATSLRSVLKKEVRIQWDFRPLSVEMKAELSTRLKFKKSLPDTVPIGTIPLEGKKVYLLIDRAPSKTETFDYALYLNEDGSILAVDVLVYREQQGSEIDHPAFRKQFVGKNNPQKIIPGRTIQAISGATISSRSITYSVRDLLTIFQKLRREEGE